MTTIHGFILPSTRVQQFERICDVLYDFGEKYLELSCLDEGEDGEDEIGDLVDGTSLRILGEIEKYEWF